MFKEHETLPAERILSVLFRTPTVVDYQEVLTSVQGNEYDLWTVSRTPKYIELFNEQTNSHEKKIFAYTKVSLIPAVEDIGKHKSINRFVKVKDLKTSLNCGNSLNCNSILQLFGEFPMYH